ncbi:GYF domain-containing protein [Rhizobium lemnae]|uniref:GYF domain-containing protein n=1 Tax=Rhizobium lemnae TaxID=1214924 RepID=A0ABV8EE39_9HYPH|nr:GYF domain-containing protein [Rhizobium lemnae]MCJ8510713.1 GYF domain-containing protein [Rhizobium lemnae]
MPEIDAKWFYSIDGDRKGPFSEEQISALLMTGVVNEHTKVWSEKIADWTPLFHTELRKLLGDKQITPPDVAPVDKATPQPRNHVEASTFSMPNTATTRRSMPSTIYGMYDNRLLGKFLYAALMLNFFASIAVIILTLKKKTIQERYSFFTMMESEEAMLLLGAPVLLATLLFLIWKYRATANAFHVAGPQSVTPAGAVYWYFVPVLWFWKPYEAMRNIHNAFVGSGNHEAVQSWWFAWWLSVAIALGLAFVLPASAAEAAASNSFGPYMWWSIIILGADATSFFMAARLIKKLSAAETLRMGQSAVVAA